MEYVCTYIFMCNTEDPNYFDPPVAFWNTTKRLMSGIAQTKLFNPHYQRHQRQIGSV